MPACLHTVHVLRSLTLTIPAVSSLSPSSQLCAPNPSTAVGTSGAGKVLERCWKGAGLAECSAPSPMIAGRSTALMPSCGAKERVKLAPGPKLRAGASLLHKGPCLLDAPQGLAPPCLLQAPPCPTGTEKQSKVQERIWGSQWGPAALPHNRLLVRRWRCQNSKAFFLRSFLFHRARRSNSSMLIPNTSWNSSGDRCLSSRVRSTSLGSFTRIRFVTMRES